MSQPKPTATLIDAHRWEFRRALPGTAAQLWSYLTISEKTALWFGPFERVSDTGVAVTMTAEEPGPPMTVRITECGAPHVLKLDTGIWQLDLAVGDGFIALYQDIETGEEAASIGPGWEFYMDRLAAAVRGDPVAAIDFEADYFPAMAPYFETRY